MKISQTKRRNKKHVKQSNVKHSNQKKLKLGHARKSKINKKKAKLCIQKPDSIPADAPVEENIEAENFIEMIDTQDMDFLKNAYNNKSYNLFSKTNFGRNKSKNKEKEVLEEKYEKSFFKVSEDSNKKDMKLMLPIKTADGIIKKQLAENINNKSTYENTETETETENNKYISNETLVNMDSSEVSAQPVSTVELLINRTEKLKFYRFKIGVLCSEILENPEEKSSNFLVLLRYMEEKNQEVHLTVQKLATASLLEIFKDLLPSYNIWLIDKKDVKLKKETLQLQNYEASILKYYKQYLQKLEKMGNKLKKKGKELKSQKDNNIGIFAVKCMTDLLVAKPYFNFSSNIAKFLIPFLNHQLQNVRNLVANCFEEIFREDNRGDISLIIVRDINKFIKSHNHLVYTEITSVLLSLRIQNINLDKEKESKSKINKLEHHRKRVIALSKKERKRKRKLEEIETEMLETKAEENKQTKHKVFTEITSLLFTIYFRVLKKAPRSKMLSSCLEGLLKFSSSINIDFYQDLVDALDNLLNEEYLNLKDQLLCIHTSFAILSGQVSTLKIDSLRFYTHLYSKLLEIHVGQSENGIDIVLRALLQVLVYRCKNISHNRLIAFVKRICSMSLNLHHSGALAIISIIRLIMQNHESTNILLDTDSGVGNGIYLPELDDPEYCNAQCTSLWEMVALQRHYHQFVQSIAKNVLRNNAVEGESHSSLEILKLSPEEIYKQNNVMSGIFNPTANIPKRPKKILTRFKPNGCDGVSSFAETVNSCNSDDCLTDTYFNIFEEIKKNRSSECK